MGAARIALDLLGGDKPPAVVVEGALLARFADPDPHQHLAGIERADEVLVVLPAATASLQERL